MKQLSLTRLGSKLLLLAALALPEISRAQYFTSTDNGDVNAGFRKTGTAQENYEMVVYLGNITNFVALSPGTTITITNYTHQQLTNMCPDNLGNLKWSVFSSFSADTLSSPVGTYPGSTCWYTVPRTNTSLVSLPINRLGASIEPRLSQHIYGTADGANAISQALGTTNVYNNTLVVLEPISLADSLNELTFNIGDTHDSTKGDFTGDVINFTVENTTSNNFASSAVSDFFQNVPASSAAKGTFIDPITLLTNGPAYNLGYFTLSSSGVMTFTRASAAPAPGTITGNATNGFAPLTVIFTNTASSGSITSWIWSFGDGHFVTNTTAVNATNTYSTGGTYTVILTVVGSGGSTSTTNTAFIVASSKPIIKVAQINGNLVIFGTNCPGGIQYRIFSTTNLSKAFSTWKPMVTNNFLSNSSFSYTNSTTNAANFYQLISP